MGELGRVLELGGFFKSKSQELWRNWSLKALKGVQTELKRMWGFRVRKDLGRVCEALGNILEGFLKERKHMF